MDPRELLLLGLLITQRQHGYQIHDFIDKNLRFVTNMKKATAYALLDKLHKEDYIDVSIEHAGNRPPRKVYSINENGIRYFRHLLLKNLASAETIFYESDIGLLFLNHLPTEETKTSLQKKYCELQQKYADLKKIPLHTQISGVNLALRHKQTMLEAELSFLQETLNMLAENE